MISKVPVIIPKGLVQNLIDYKNELIELLNKIMRYVYLVHHTHVISDKNEDVKLIGAFSSKEKALKVVEKYKQLPGFKEAKRGFDIDRYQIDEEWWSKGFHTTQ